MSSNKSHRSHGPGGQADNAIQYMFKGTVDALGRRRESSAGLQKYVRGNEIKDVPVQTTRQILGSIAVGAWKVGSWAPKTVYRIHRENVALRAQEAAEKAEANRKAGIPPGFRKGTRYVEAAGGWVEGLYPDNPGWVRLSRFTTYAGGSVLGAVIVADLAARAFTGQHVADELVHAPKGIYQGSAAVYEMAKDELLEYMHSNDDDPRLKYPTIQVTVPEPTTTAPTTIS